MSLPDKQPVQLMQNILRLAVQPQQIKEIKQRQHDDAATENMSDGQSFDKLIASALRFFILMQQRKRRIATVLIHEKYEKNREDIGLFGI